MELLFSGHRRFLLLLFVSKCESTELQESDGLGVRRNKVM